MTDEEIRASVAEAQKAVWAEVHGQDPQRSYSVADEQYR